MKKLLTKVLLLAMLSVLTSSVFATEESFFKKNMTLTVKESYAPVPSSVSNIAAENKFRHKWGVIQLEASTERDKDRRFLDDVDMEVSVALRKGARKGVENIVLFTGKITYHYVELDGGKHYFLALLPGQLINRYADNGVSLLRSDLVVQVKLSQYGRQLAEVYYNSGTEKDAKVLRKWFATIRQSSKYNVVEVPNSILPRRETPWGMVDHDKYEYEKKAE